MPITTLESAQIASTLRAQPSHSESVRFRNMLETGNVGEVDRSRVCGLLELIPADMQSEILVRVELMEAFPDFAQDLDTLLTEIDACGVPTGHPCYLNSGTMADVYGLYHDGELYAVRRSRFRKEMTGSAFVEAYVPALVRGLGHDALEQLVTYNYERGVTVSKMLNAVQPEQIADPNMVWLTLDTAKGMFDGLEDMTKRGVMPDTIYPNILIGPNGIKHVDYVLGALPASHTAELCLRKLLTVFSNRLHVGAGKINPLQLEQLKLIADEYESRYKAAGGRRFAKVMRRAIAEIPKAEWINGFA